jgi:hypothetical protein
MSPPFSRLDRPVWVDSSPSAAAANGTKCQILIASIHATAFVAIFDRRDK